jgi:hypothetical protein
MKTFTRPSSIAALLRIVATFMILDGGVFFLPETWINAFLVEFGLEQMPHAALMRYALQMGGYLQIALGALVWVIARDVVRYRPLVITTIAIFLFGAPAFYLLDAAAGLPAWVSLMDFVTCVGCGGIPLVFCLWPAKTPLGKMQPTAATPNAR